MCIRDRPIEHGPEKACTVVKLPNDPSGPSMARQVMVQPILGPPGSDPKGPSTQTGPSVSAPRKHSARQSRLPPPSRVEALCRSVTQRGFSQEAASLIAKAKRPSTSAVYDAKWTVFTRWCLRRRVDPLHPSLGKVADFLIFLFEERNCSPSTIKGYRSALSNTLKFGGGRDKEIGSDPRISS